MCPSPESDLPRFEAHTHEALHRSAHTCPTFLDISVWLCSPPSFLCLLPYVPHSLSSFLLRRVSVRSLPPFSDSSSGESRLLGFGRLLRQVTTPELISLGTGSLFRTEIFTCICPGNIHSRRFGRRWVRPTGLARGICLPSLSYRQCIDGAVEY